MSVFRQCLHMRVITRIRMILPSLHNCRWAVLFLSALSIGFYTGFYVSLEKEIKCSLEVFDKDVQDVDYNREIVRKLQYVADEIEGTASQNALLELHNVMVALDPQMAVSDLARTVLPETNDVKPPDACGEIFESPELPFYKKGFVPDPNCDPHSKPSLESLVTVVLLAPKKGTAQNSIDRPITALRNIYPRIRAIVGTDKRVVKTDHIEETTVVQVSSDAFDTPGKLWNRLVKHVRTPYVLVARDVARVDELARLPRLVHVLSTNSGRPLAVAGGAVRYSSGHWRAGCLQTHMRHYALRLQRGYRFSSHDCMLCDHLEGPFLARADLLRERPFNADLPGTVVFEDWFLHLKRHGVVSGACPDVLFFVSREFDENSSGHKNRDDWRQLALRWQLDRVLRDDRHSMNFKCKEVGLQCDLGALHRRGLLVPSCCVDQVVGALQAFDKFASRHELDYELCEGTALGAVKLRSFMPWDIDGDIFIRLADFNKYQENRYEMSDLGYPFRHFQETKDHKYFNLYTPDVSIDMWCRPIMSTAALPEEMQGIPTRVEVNGLWLRGFWNPGLASRNRYGPGYLKHALHWTRQGMKTHMDAYRVGYWGNCSYEKHHACLNRYPTEGSFDLVYDDCS